MPARLLFCVLAAAVVLPRLPAQARPREFDVASVKPNQTADQPASNFPMGPGAMYHKTGGVFSARNLPLSFYIQFAWKMSDYQRAAIGKQLPSWANADRYDIEARSEGEPSKDEMRAMMQTLLADRFHLAVHHTILQVPVFALVSLHPGHTGPNLTPHPATDTCSSDGAVPTDSAQAKVVAWPVVCGGMDAQITPPPVRVRVGARNIPLSLLATQMLNMGDLDRPVVDATQLPGLWDFVLEYADHDVSDEDAGPTFLEAIKRQLGLKLEPQKAPLDTILLDHVDRPSEN